jgi:UDP-N-acetylmuramoyl-tripeptide--D-alanyl-D-alanine ligase
VKYTVENITEIIAGNRLQSSSREHSIDYLLTDSRKLIFPETSIFFALGGARRDGHQFLRELYERGVRNFVVDQKIKDQFPDANIIKVSDALSALQQLAAYHRRQFNIPVIAISGSNGKTIVKEWLNQLLEDRYNIVRSPRSYNSQIGVPLSVWQMNESHELGIFEAGISLPGEMKKLETVIRPTIGVFTNIGEAHGEGFKSNEKKIKEKLQLFKHAKTLIYCKDQLEIDVAVLQASEDHGPALFSWGKRAGADVRIRSIKKTESGTTVHFDLKKENHSLMIPFTDQASLENVMTCICVLIHFQGDVTDIQGKIFKLTPVAMRLELKTGINNCSIINDSYSADISSLKIALDFLSQQQQHAKRTVILSDILQSGKEEKKLYKEVAQLLQQKKINRLVAVGDRIS